MSSEISNFFGINQNTNIPFEAMTPYCQIFLGEDNDSVIRNLKNLDKNQKLKVFEELTIWVAQSPHPKSLMKLQNLVDCAEQGGMLDELVGAMHRNPPEKASNGHNFAILASVGDKARFDKLFDSAEKQDMLMDLLNAYGSIPIEGKMQSLGPQSALRAAAKCGQHEIAEKILDKIESLETVRLTV